MSATIKLTNNVFSAARVCIDSSTNKVITNIVSGPLDDHTYCA